MAPARATRSRAYLVVLRPDRGNGANRVGRRSQERVRRAHQQAPCHHLRPTRLRSSLQSWILPIGPYEASKLSAIQHIPSREHDLQADAHSCVWEAKKSQRRSDHGGNGAALRRGHPSRLNHHRVHRTFQCRCKSGTSALSSRSRMESCCVCICRGPVCFCRVPSWQIWAAATRSCQNLARYTECSAPDVRCATRVRWVTKPDLQVPRVLTREN